MLETQLYLVNGVVALLAAAIPIYLTIMLNKDLRQLTAILSIFILVHAVHSWLAFLGLISYQTVSLNHFLLQS